MEAGAFMRCQSYFSLAEGYDEQPLIDSGLTRQNAGRSSQGRLLLDS